MELIDFASLNFLENILVKKIPIAIPIEAIVAKIAVWLAIIVPIIPNIAVPIPPVAKAIPIPNIPKVIPAIIPSILGQYFFFVILLSMQS